MEVQETQETPENQETPETQENRDTGEIKETPETQENRDTGEIKETPETQENRETGEIKETPETQENRDTGETAKTLETPENQEIQATPEIQETPKFQSNFQPGFQKRPFKIVDFNGEKRIGIVARGLNDLMERAHVKLNIPPEIPVRVALEEDGTEVEDEEYFSTVPSNTAFVILVGEQKWLPCIKTSVYPPYCWDEPDREEKPPPEHLEKLVDKLYSDMTCITLLGGQELEMLSDMETDILADVVPEEDRAFLGNLKEASFRILAEKDQAKEAMELLKLYHARYVGDYKKEKKDE